jgi:hypothetical protein
MHHTPREKQSPEVAFGNTAFPLATLSYHIDFTAYYFFKKNNVAILKHHHLPRKNIITFRNN